MSTIVLAPFGTRGDVEPLLALGTELQRRGHRCTLAAPANFAPNAADNAMPFFATGPDFLDFHRGTHSEWRVLAAMARAIPEQFQGVMAASEGADAIVGSMLSFAAPSIARVRDIPYIYAVLSPLYLRADTTVVPGAPVRWLPRIAVRMAYWVQDALTVFALSLQAEQRKLGLPAVRNGYAHLANSGELLLAYDEALLPTPGGVGGSPHHVGLMRRDSATDALPDTVRAFLDAGQPPVYIGFGSMSHADPARITRLLLDAIRRSGVRAVIAAGWSELKATDMPPNVLLLAQAPHDLLFPKCAAVVHHGGAGTLSAAAWAGVPQAVVWHWGDQYHHGWRVNELGVGPPPLAIRKLRADRLAAIIRRLVDDDAARTNAAALGAAMRSHAGGAARAADVVEQAIAARRR